MTGLKRTPATILKQLPVILVLITGVAMMVSCDSADSEDCSLVTDDLKSRSVALLGSGNTPVAHFDLQQELKTYQQGCSRSDVDEVSLVIRNATSCQQTVSYSISVFAGQIGWTFNNSIDLEPTAAFDMGTINRDGGVDIEAGQVLVTGQSVQGTCS